MANTTIQVKRSTVTNIPGSLGAGEPAYSYSSNVMYIGTSDGAGVLPVGGQFYVTKTNSAYTIASAAYDAANNAGSTAAAGAAFDKANSANYFAYLVNANTVAAFDKANSATTAAGAAFDKANSANVLAYDNGLIASGAFDKANGANYFAYLVNANTVAAFDKANSSTTTAGAAFDKANSANILAYDNGIIASGAFDKANSANYFAYLVNANTVAAFDKANSGYDIAVGSFIKANAANLAAGAGFDKANSGYDIAVAAYNNANSKFSSSGGTITGNVSIVGDLIITGNTQFNNVSTLTIGDPLIYLAANNYVSDIVDIGFIGNYVNATGSNVHTGFFRNHEDKEYYLFYGYDIEPVDNHINPAGNNFTIAVLNADLKTSNLVLGGVNAINWITAAYGTANSSTLNGGAAFDKANSAYDIGVAAFGKANTGYDIAVAAFNTTNSVSTAASAAFDKANSANYFAFLVNANTVAAFDKANSATTAAGAAFDTANSVGGAVTTANLIATSAFAAANAASAQAANADFISSGTLAVAYGGTGKTTFTTNGVLYGNTAGPLKVTSAGTEGQVLQADAAGVPQFAMLDGGSF